MTTTKCKFSNRFLSVLLAVVMLVGMLPFSVLASTETVITVGAFTVTGVSIEEDTDYVYSDGVLTILSDKIMTIANTTPDTATTDIIFIDDGVSANIILAGVNIDASEIKKAAFQIADNSEGNVTVILADNTTNTLIGGNRCAGLQKSGAYISENKGKLTITGTGTLNAKGGYASPGIGGAGYKESANITIINGTIYATGGYGGAGIGGGYNIASYITISGGTITATGGQYAAGIGGGRGTASKTVSNITISGGVITATGGQYGAGIGGGYETVVSENLIISGGSVKGIPGQLGQAVGRGGKISSVKTSEPTNGTENVYLLEIENPNGEDIVINGKDYPDNHNDEKKIYVYLPAMTITEPNVVAVGTAITKYYYDTSNSKWNVIVEIPEKDETKFIYNGEEKTYSIAESGYYTVSNNKQINADEYVVTVSLNDGCIWSDGTTEEKQYNFVINKAESSIGTVTANTLTDTLDISQVVLSRSDESIAGTLKLTDTVLSYGTNTYNWEFTPSSSNYTVLTGTVEITVKDTVKPTVEITLGTNKWYEFIDNVTFGLFIKNTKTVTITAEDGGGTVNAIYYYLSDEAVDNVFNIHGDEWEEYTEAFSIPNSKYIIYAKAVDKAGNVTYVNSDGIVLYTDSEADTESVTTTYKAVGDKNVTVILNGNTVKSVACGETTLTAGTDYSVSSDGATITLKAVYLDTLDVGDYTFTVSYNPLGLTYVEGNNNEAPATTTFKVVVEKADVNDVKIPAIISGLIYDGNEHKLIDAGSAEGGEMQYSLDGTTYSADVPTAKEAGKYTVYYKVVGDENHNDVTPQTLTVEIGEATLTDVSVVQKGTLTYDGGKDLTPEVDATATAVNNQKVTFTYSTKENSTYSSMPTFTAAGEYIVYYKASAPNHEDKTGSFTVTVNKAIVTVPTVASKTYTGSVQTADIADTDLYTVEQNNGGMTVGSYDVVLKLKDSKNYKWENTDDAEVTLPFVIALAENTWITTPAVEGWTYGENANTPTYEAKFGTVKVVYTGTANDGTAYSSETAPTKAGNYTATFTVDGTADYSGLSEQANFTIAKATYNMNNAKWDYTDAFQYDGLKKSVAVVGLPEGVTVSEYAGNTATVVGDYTAKATLSYDSNNYNTVTFNDLTWKIENNWTPTEYTVSTPNANGWLNEDFVITANSGYELSLTNTAEGVWSDTLTGAVEGENSGVTFYVRNKATSAISLAKTVTYKLDKNTEMTGTTGTVEFVERTAWQKFVNNITFGLFYKDEVKVKVTAADALSDVESIEYVESDKALSLDDVKALTGWTVMPENGVCVTVADTKQFVYYVRITDKAGNETYLSTNGAEYDTTAPAISGIENGATYYTTQKVTVTDKNLKTVTLNDEAVTITENGAVIILDGNKEATYTIVATDKAGNTTTYAVTMAEIADITADTDDVKSDNVTSADKEDLQAVIDAVDELLKDEELTEDETQKLEEIKQAAQELINAIDSIAEDIKEITDTVDELDDDPVTSADKETVEKVIADVTELLDSDNLTDDERKTLEDIKDEAQKLIDKINEAADATETENTENVKDVTADTVTPDDKENLENAKSDLEKALDEHGDNYTEDEKKAFQDEINRIDEALKVIENVEAVEDKINSLPDTITKDDEAAIKTAEEAYNALTDYEKTLVNEDVKKALDNAVAALAELNKPAESTSPNTGDNSNLWLWFVLIFVSGGAVITLTVYDRKNKQHVN